MSNLREDSIVLQNLFISLQIDIRECSPRSTNQHVQYIILLGEFDDSIGIPYNTQELSQAGNLGNLHGNIENDIGMLNDRSMTSLGSSTNILSTCSISLGEFDIPAGCTCLCTYIDTIIHGNKIRSHTRGIGFQGLLCRFHFSLDRIKRVFQFDCF